jgi:hypothetical protein
MLNVICFCRREHPDAGPSRQKDPWAGESETLPPGPRQGPPGFPGSMSLPRERTEAKGKVQDNEMATRLNDTLWKILGHGKINLQAVFRIRKFLWIRILLNEFGSCPSCNDFEYRYTVRASGISCSECASSSYSKKYIILGLDFSSCTVKKVIRDIEHFLCEIVYQCIFRNIFGFTGLQLLPDIHNSLNFQNI